MIGIDDIKDVLIGLSGDTESWNSDLTSNLDDDLAHDIVRLQIELKLLKDSYQRNDLITVQCALVRARSMLLSISNFFKDLADDTEELLLSKKGELPEIPGGYDVPESYRYIIPKSC
ncbi:hypothetical protein R84981_001258 [Carnimonas sp. R-84981]|uniref:hypothetical protein n=1 Tax=Carnimonas bestiolae TaxID=3402172 RepID=UPI003EDC88FF